VTTERKRLDVLLVERGLFPTREQARRAVMAGIVEVGGQAIDKPGTAIRADDDVSVREKAEPFVSRAGRKLAAALERFGIDPSGSVCMDVGASTGGFTDCLLQRGARRVYAIDVGYGQLDQRLREDARVVVMERVNARYLEADAVPEACDLITVDVSFISLAKVVPALLPHLAEDGRLVTLIKPQFEAGRAAVGKGGIVRDEAVRGAAIEAIVRALEGLGLSCVDRFDSPVAGARGNREALAVFTCGWEIGADRERMNRAEVSTDD
jgi:23S rRNA (cytidine1920-2'-O)/16S rRNA (cytidine1409-2'-O)-methyltransferase